MVLGKQIKIAKNKLMDAGVRAKFGVKGCAENIFLANEDWGLLVGGENLGRGLVNFGGADKNSWEFFNFEVRNF